MTEGRIVLVYLEVTAGHPVALDALEAGRQVAEHARAGLAGVIMGHGMGAAAEDLQAYGLERIYVVDHPLLERYQGEIFAAALAEVCRIAGPAYVLMPNSLNGLDLAPRLAWELEVGLVTDCVAVEKAGSEAGFVKPVYSGNVMAVYTAARRPLLVTVRPRAFGAPPSGSAAQAEIVPVTFAIDPVIARIRLGELMAEDAEGVNLETAERVVAGGRGMGGAPGFALLREVADILGAAVGASRPPCDLGWIAAKAQVGQTGAIVAPGLYIAVGIAGSTQHLAGMAGAKTIVAINKDPQAAIFRIADYGVVGAYEEVMPSFAETLRGILA